MWKYVTRRFRDTVERTSNILDVKKTWTCNGERFISTNFSEERDQKQQPAVKHVRQRSLCYFAAHKRGKNNSGAGQSSSSSSNDEFREKIHAKNAYFKNYSLLSALTWVNKIFIYFVCFQQLNIKTISSINHPITKV